MDKQKQLKQIYQQIDGLQSQALQLRAELKAESMPKYEEYIGTFIKIEDTSGAEGPVYAYVTDIEFTRTGTPTVKGTCIYKEYNNYKCYQSGVKYLESIHKITPITKFDWDNLLQKIIKDYTIQIPV
jgi:hypothetical protein